MRGCGWLFFFFVQAEDGIRDLVRSRGLGDVYKRQASATDGSTTLTGTACNDTVAVSIYDIDFGTYLATDVLGQTKVNGGTK